MRVVRLDRWLRIGLGGEQPVWVKGLPALGLIWLLGAVGDRLWFALDRAVPNWDQADYLTGALNYWRALQAPHWFSADWWTSLWLLSSKIPPLVYLSTAPFLSLFGTGFDQSALVQLLYGAILLSSVYALGVYLFSVSAGLWAAGLCLLMPGLYRVRLDYLLDYPLAAMVTLCFACLTFWRTGSGQPQKGYQAWWLAIAVGITLGLALMVKQPALLFLVVPLGWVGVEVLWQRAWKRLVQLVLAGGVAMLVFGPWYRTNWLQMLSASKRATVDSAIAEGDPSLLSLDAWTIYLRVLPGMVSLPLLAVGLIGLVFFWRRSRVSCLWAGGADYAPKPDAYREQIYAASRRSLGWLIGFWAGSYLLSSLNINKDTRYVVPYLPVLAVILAYGFTLLPKRWKMLRWGAVGLAGVIMLYNLLPIKANGLHSQIAYHPAYLGAKYPHPEVIQEVIKAEPYLRSTIGVLPSTAEINQHNFNYYGNLKNFQVFGRQVGTRLKFVEQDGRSLSWFITKTGDQGSIRKANAQTAITQLVEQGGDFKLQRQWPLPDGSVLKLFSRRVPLLEVGRGDAGMGGRGRAGTQKQGEVVRLDQVIVPERAPAGQPIPVTYRWSGTWETLQSGLVLLTWSRQGETRQGTPRWLHDHAIALGNLHLADKRPNSSPTTSTRYQVVERMAMLPPADLPAGIYTLTATYLDRHTGERTIIAVPSTNLRIDPTATPSPAPEVDLVSQLRSLAATLPQGRKALDPIFDQIGRINQYDPVQDYLDQSRQAMEARLRQEPDNRDFAYALALSQVLKRRVNPAIAALETVTRIDPQNPNAYAYLAFVNLYDFRPRNAQTALDTALKLDPQLPELHALNAVAALMRGNLVKTWQESQVWLRSEGSTNTSLPSTPVARR